MNFELGFTEKVKVIDSGKNCEKNKADATVFYAVVKENVVNSNFIGAKVACMLNSLGFLLLHVFF